MPIDFSSFGGGKAILIYRGVDISSELSPETTSINYTDNWHGEADEIDVTVQDKDGKWKGPWLPEHGDTMQLLLSDNGVSFVDCGTFELDEPHVRGSRSGDTMTIRGLAAPISKPLRTANTYAYEDKDLRAIVNEVAGRTGLSIEGEIDALSFKRITQRRERDLEFLKRLAEDTGHYFSVRNTRAVFTSYASIDGRSPTLVIDLENKALDAGRLIDYSFKIQSQGTYSKGSLQYSDPDKKEVTRHEEPDPRVKTGDELKVRGERVENKANAEALVKARLHMANRKQKTGSMTMIGNMRALAGNTLLATGFGGYSDKYVIDSSGHAISRSGYTTSVELSLAKQ
jgi:hypothetical protein